MDSWQARVSRWMFALLSAAASATCVARGNPLSFEWPPNWTVPSDTPGITLEAPRVQSACFGGAYPMGCIGYLSGRLELWAFPTPFIGEGKQTPSAPMGGFRLASNETPPEGTAMQPYLNWRRATVPYTPPPPGTYYLSMLIVGAYYPDTPYIYDAYNFKDPVVIGSDRPAPPPPPFATVTEFYNAAMDHYFLTANPVEIDLCNRGVAPCAGWAPTGQSFLAYDGARAPVWSTAACRFYNDSFAPKSSHFYALKGYGCEQTLQSFPDWKLETDKAFNTVTSLDGLSCPPLSVPVYRLYNDGMGGAPNHRFTTQESIRSAMTLANWVFEQVAFCAPDLYTGAGF